MQQIDLQTSQMLIYCKKNKLQTPVHQTQSVKYIFECMQLPDTVTTRNIIYQIFNVTSPLITDITITQLTPDQFTPFKLWNLLGRENVQMVHICNIIPRPSLQNQASQK